MARYDVEREPNPETAKRALREYKGGLKDIRYDAIAMFIAQGESITKAYSRAFPDASKEAAATQASILCAHPAMREKIRDQKITARNMIQAALPRSVRKTVELLEAESEQVQLKAASSIQDRAGLPTAAELSVHATVTGASLYQSALEESDILEADLLPDPSTEITIEGSTKAHKQAVLGPAPHTPTEKPLEALEAHRAEWWEMAPDVHK